MLLYFKEPLTRLVLMNIVLRVIFIVWCWLSPRITVYTTTMMAAKPEMYSTLVRQQVITFQLECIPYWCLNSQFLCPGHTRLTRTFLFQGLPTKLRGVRAANSLPISAAECPENHRSMQIHRPVRDYIINGGWKEIQLIFLGWRCFSASNEQKMSWSFLSPLYL